MGQRTLAVMEDVPWQHLFWKPEPIWRGEMAFLLGSGPSLTAEIAAKLCGRHVIAVNSSASLAPWAEVLFFTDASWWEPRQDLVANWPGLVISLSRHAKRGMPDKVKRIHGETRCDFAPVGSETVRQGRSSGHTAIGLAVALGATTIVLMGYDMRVVDGREHFHDEYRGAPGRDLALYANQFLPGFKGWNAAALKAGVEIINATPNSALTEFPMADLDEML